LLLLFIRQVVVADKSSSDSESLDSNDDVTAKRGSGVTSTRSDDVTRTVVKETTDDVRAPKRSTNDSTVAAEASDITPISGSGDVIKTGVVATGDVPIAGQSAVINTIVDAANDVIHASQATVTQSSLQHPTKTSSLTTDQPSSSNNPITMATHEDNNFIIPTVSVNVCVPEIIDTVVSVQQLRPVEFEVIDAAECVLVPVTVDVTQTGVSVVATCVANDVTTCVESVSVCGVDTASAEAHRLVFIVYLLVYYHFHMSFILMSRHAFGW